MPSISLHTEDLHSSGYNGARNGGGFELRASAETAAASVYPHLLSLTTSVLLLHERRDAIMGHDADDAHSIFWIEVFDQMEPLESAGMVL
jgi:hypothetical protein